MSSANHMLFVIHTFMFIPVSCASFASLVTISSSRLKRSDGIPYLCLTPTLILKYSVNTPSILTALTDMLLNASVWLALRGAL